MRVIQVLLCFAVAATASSSAFTAAVVDPDRTVIYVNGGAEPGGDGSWNFPYRYLRPALNKARATAGPVAIHVAPGHYVVNSTLVINRPLILRGSSVLVRDPYGDPTGEVLPGTETRIVASVEVGAKPLISVGRADGVVISGVTIRNLVLTHANSLATQLSIRRVQDYRVRNNVFRSGGRVGLESIASSGEVIGNHFSHLKDGAILAAGYPESPSNVLFQRNLLVDNERAVLLNGSSTLIPEHGDLLIADVLDNFLHSNGFGVHLSIISRESGLPGDTQETGNIRALLDGNFIASSSDGHVVIDAGYPYRELEGGACDPRNYSGSIDLTVEYNLITENLAGHLQVTLTRWPGGLESAEPDFLAAWDYLHATRITISDPHGIFQQFPPGGTIGATIFYENPERDPHVGSCAGDEHAELLGNVLRYNGRRLRGTGYLLGF